MCLHKGPGQHVTTHFLPSLPLSVDSSRWPAHRVSMHPDVCEVWVCLISAAQRHWVRVLQRFLARGFLPRLGEGGHNPAVTRGIGCDVNITAKASLLCYSCARVDTQREGKKTRHSKRGKKTSFIPKTALLRITASWVCGCVGGTEGFFF